MPRLLRFLLFGLYMYAVSAKMVLFGVTLALESRTVAETSILELYTNTLEVTRTCVLL